MKLSPIFLLPVILASTCLQAQDHDPPAVDEAAYLQHADLALRDGRLTQAAQMITWLERNGADESRNDVALLRAEYAIAISDVAAADAALKGIGDADRNLCRLQTAKGWVSAHLRAYDDAIVALAEAGRACPDDAGVWNLLGLVLVRKGESVAAATAFQRAGDLAPNDPGILNNHALALLQSGEVELAMSQLDYAAAASPDNGMVAANRDFVSGMLGRTPVRLPQESDADFGKRLVSHAQGAKAAANDRQAKTLFSRALLALDRFDQKIWSQIELQEVQP